MKQFDLNKYIDNLYKLETSLYKQESIRRNLQNNINNINYDKKIIDEYNSQEDLNFSTLDTVKEMAWSYVKSSSPFSNVKRLEEPTKLSYFYEAEIFKSFLGGAVIIFMVSYIGFIVFNGLSVLLAAIPKSILISVTAFAMLCLIYLIRGIVGYTSKVQEIERVNELTKKENEKIIKNNLLLYKERQLQKSNMQKELEFLNTSISETKSLLKQYYDLDIVYYKYRNFTAISSFNEYLKSGLCSELVGHGGAYDVYETQIRMDGILTKLDKIIEKLEQIKQNQHMLYVAIKEANNTSENILREIKNIKDQNIDILNNTCVTAKNSYITACNSQITAQNTEFLKWYQVYRN